jgi:hypothetical protein
MGKSSKIAGDQLVLTAKAIRRAEKLERTLTKLVVVQEPGSATETLLKAVQKGLDRLRKDESAEPRVSASAAATSGSKRPRKSQKSTLAEPQAETD